MPKDPICGKDVDINTKWKLFYENKAYYFCNKPCMEQFKRKFSEKLGKRDLQEQS